jgi:hypothetical protein
MVTWTKCGVEKKEDAKFCSSYGVAVKKAIEEEILRTLDSFCRERDKTS